MTSLTETAPPGRERPRGAWRRTEAARGLVLISPTFLYALLLLGGPIATIILFSFWTQTYLDIDRTPTLTNYVVAWTDPIYRLLMARSLGVSAATTVATLLLAYPVAYYIAFHVERHRALWILAVTIPFWTSYLLRVFAWKLVLGYNGVLNSGLMAFGFTTEPISAFVYNLNAVVLTLSHAYAPFAVLPIYVSLLKIDRSLLEAATDLGDGPIRRFLRVTLPLSLPGVIAAGLLVFIPTVGDYVTPRLVGGPDGLMIANAIQIQFGKANNWPLGAALAVSAMLIVTAVALCAIWALRRVTRGGPA